MTGPFLLAVLTFAAMAGYGMAKLLQWSAVRCEVGDQLAADHDRCPDFVPAEWDGGDR